MSSETELPSYNNYEIVAIARGQKPVYYEQFGSFSGDWVMLAKGEEYAIYKDYYGSCSGCDALEATDPRPTTLTQALRFAKAYPPFVEIPVATMKNFCANGTLKQVVPRNRFDLEGADSIVASMECAAKLEEGWPLLVRDVLNPDNAELRQRALKAYDPIQFIADAKAKTIDKRGEDSLIFIPKQEGQSVKENLTLLYVKDTSTPRRYLLGVPAEMKTVREAVAWTFGMNEKDYAPLIES